MLLSLFPSSSGELVKVNNRIGDTMSDVHTQFKPHRVEKNEDGDKRVVLNQPKRSYFALGNPEVFYIIRENKYVFVDASELSEEQVEELGLTPTAKITEKVNAEAQELLKAGKNVDMYKLYKKFAPTDMKSPKHIQDLLDKHSLTEDQKILQRLIAAQNK